MIFAAPTEMVSAIEAAGVEVKAALREQVAEPLVYLLDSAGAGFGYSYEWDAFGPHSNELAADIADLTDVDLERTEELDEPLKSAADRVREILDPPPSLGLDKAAWLRLVAAVDYLRRVAGLDLTNGDRPPYVKRNFEEPAIEAAKERAALLHP